MECILVAKHTKYIGKQYLVMERMPPEGIITVEVKSFGSYTRDGGLVWMNMGAWNGKEENTPKKSPKP